MLAVLEKTGYSCYLLYYFMNIQIWATTNWIWGFHPQLLANQTHEIFSNNKQLLKEVFMIRRIINVEVRVIGRTEGETDNCYRNIDSFAYHKNRAQ